MAIQSLSIAHGFLSAILVGSATFAFLVVLVRGGHLTILTTVVERVHYEFPSTTAHCHCPEPETCSSPSESQALHPKLFQEISALKASESTLQAARAIDWESILLTPNGGFLMVEEFDHQIKGYGVSMFHQLHCLAMVRGMLLGKATSSEHEVDKNWMKDPLHYLHCLDYMTQGILCAADDTLEKPGPTKNAGGEIIDGIDGMDHTHQCRNATLLWEAVYASEVQPRRAGLLGQSTVFP